MLLQDSHLKFGDIADRWARENTDHPGALSRGQIVDQLKEALRRGEFDFATLTVGQAPRDVLVDSSPGGPPNYVRVGPSRLVVTRDILNKMLFRFPVPDELTIELWLEGLRISKDDFGRWCDDQDMKRPRFWFGSEPQLKPKPESERAPKIPSPAPEIKCTPEEPADVPSRREQGKQKTKDRYCHWHDLSKEIKKDGQKRLPIVLAGAVRRILKKEQEVYEEGQEQEHGRPIPTKETIKRRLNDLFSGWAG